MKSIELFWRGPGWYVGALVAQRRLGDPEDHEEWHLRDRSSQAVPEPIDNHCGPVWLSEPWPCWKSTVPGIEDPSITVYYYEARGEP